MTEINLKGKILKLQDSTDELTIDLYNQVNAYALQDAEIGNTPKDTMRHFAKIDESISARDWDTLILNRKNLHMNTQAMHGYLNFIGLQFASHIVSWNKEVVTDHSFESMTRLLADLSKEGLTMKTVREFLEASKKKSNAN